MQRNKNIFNRKMAKTSKICISNAWSAVCMSHIQRHDTQHNDIQYNDT